MRKDSEIWIMLIIAACTIAGIAFIEAVTMPFGPRAVLTLVFIAIFAGLLFLRKARQLPRAWVVVDASAQTALAIGVMSLGDSWMLGGILFFIICASLSYELSLPFVYAWNGVAFLSVLACSLIDERKFDLGVLPFCLGISSISALSVLLNRARKAREESLHLLGELKKAQGRIRNLAILEERQRLAREMHDAVGHRLTASAVLLEGAARLIPTEPIRAVRMVETSRDQVREGLAELRTAVSALHEDAAGNLPLSDVLGALVDVFALSAEAKVSLHVQEGLPEPDPERKLVLVRSAQEALTNAQKHSGASFVELGLRFEDEAYLFECQDDGRGPAAADAAGIASESRMGAPRGFGLDNLRARAAAFGGSVDLQRAEGGGALLRLRLPASPRKEGDLGSGIS